VLRIDRTLPQDLKLTEDEEPYTPGSILAFIKDNDLEHCISFHGVVGFVRFLRGYYMVLITQKRRVGNFGGHIVYTIENTATIPIPHQSAFEDGSTPKSSSAGSRIRYVLCKTMISGVHVCICLYVLTLDPPPPSPLLSSPCTCFVFSSTPHPFLKAFLSVI
jgi:SacI homology domain